MPVRVAYALLTLGMHGRRPRALAARQLLASAAGALIAGDSKLRMERAVRAAENAGVLAAPRR